MATHEEKISLMKQGHSPQRIRLAEQLLMAVKAGTMTRDEALAVLHGQSMQHETFDPNDPALPRAPRVRKVRNVSDAIAVFEQAFKELVDE